MEIVANIMSFMLGLSGAFIAVWFGIPAFMAENTVDARNCGFCALFGLGMVALAVLS